MKVGGCGWVLERHEAVTPVRAHQGKRSLSLPLPFAGRLFLRVSIESVLLYCGVRRVECLAGILIDIFNVIFNIFFNP